MKNYLFILPFDHRDSFIKGLFGSRYQIEDVKELKWIIYSGFKSAVEKGLVSKSSAAILIDDQFGSEILEDASRLGYMTCLSVLSNVITFFFQNLYLIFNSASKTAYRSVGTDNSVTRN